MSGLPPATNPGAYAEICLFGGGGCEYALLQISRKSSGKNLFVDQYFQSYIRGLICHLYQHNVENDILRLPEGRA